MQLPKRLTLVSQTADILRQEITAGRWGDPLPGERQLALFLQVSRVTLRAALQQLRQEGTITIRHGRHRLRQVVASRPGRTRSRVIGLLTHVPVYLMHQFDLYNVSELGRLIQAAGLRLDVRYDSRVDQVRNPDALLRQITSQTDADCWVLWACSPAIQKWFMEQHTPTIVMGTCHTGVQLASVDHDHLASARHAAAQLLSLGHRWVAMLSPRSGLAGDLAVEQAFREGLMTYPTVVTPPAILHHDDSVAGICGAMEALLNLQPRPTVLLVSHAQHLPTALTFLFTHGIRVPQQVSLVCLRGTTNLENLLPPITCYQNHPSPYARKLARLAVQFATTGTLPLRRTLVATHFQRGESLAPL